MLVLFIFVNVMSTKLPFLLMKMLYSRVRHGGQSSTGTNSSTQGSQTSAGHAWPWVKIPTVLFETSRVAGQDRGNNMDKGGDEVKDRR